MTRRHPDSRAEAPPWFAALAILVLFALAAAGAAIAVRAILRAIG
jgi:hypothetical protein